MKYLTILLVALVATCYALDCPLVEDTPTYLPDPDNCRNFYECSNGGAEKMECEECLVFNEDLQVCDFPSNVPRCSHIEECDPEPEEALEFIELV